MKGLWSLRDERLEKNVFNSNKGATGGTNQKTVKMGSSPESPIQPGRLGFPAASGETVEAGFDKLPLEAVVPASVELSVVAEMRREIIELRALVQDLSREYHAPAAGKAVVPAPRLVEAPQVLRLGTPVSKWQIERFDGRADRLARFLIRVNQFREAENVNVEDLFRNRVYLFTGNAADWIANSQARNWGQLVEELRLFSYGCNTDAEILMELAQMRQKNESVAVFVNNLLVQFQCLRVPLPEEDKVNLILRGLRPEIGSVVGANLALNTVNQVMQAAMRVEHLLGTRRGVFAVEETVPGKRSGVPSAVTAVANGSRADTEGRFRNRKPVRCYHCGQLGHVAHWCPEPTRIGCWGCGREGVRRRECPQCTPKN